MNAADNDPSALYFSVEDLPQRLMVGKAVCICVLVRIRKLLW